jgi:hydrogenase nickel incorporation protein HypA/HybF
MHEYSIVSALLDRIEAEAASRGATGVHGVQVRIGDLAGVDRDLFQTAFETFRIGTVCARAALTVIPVEARWVCPSCDGVLERGAILRCESCGEPAKLARGDEIVLDRIELEVP